VPAAAATLTKLLSRQTQWPFAHLLDVSGQLFNDQMRVMHVNSGQGTQLALRIKEMTVFLTRQEEAVLAVYGLWASLT